MSILKMRRITTRRRLSLSVVQQPVLAVRSVTRFLTYLCISGNACDRSSRPNGFCQRYHGGKTSAEKLVRGAADGYSSYGNQIGLATGYVKEIYHPDYVAKRMEIGAVMGAAPRRAVQRLTSRSGRYHHPARRKNRT